MADHPMNFADAALLNAAAIYVGRVTADAADNVLMIGVMSEVVNNASWDHKYIGPIVDAVRRFLDSKPNENTNLRVTHADFIRNIDFAVMHALRWRLGESLEIYRTRKQSA